MFLFKDLFLFVRWLLSHHVLLYGLLSTDGDLFKL